MTDDTNRKGSEEARRQAKGLAEDARQAGQQAYDTVKDEAGHQAEEAQSRIASEAGDVAQALRKAAEASRDGSPQERTFGQIADALADASEGFNRKDLGELVSDANHFARRNPIAFLGGAVLLGFAAARFAKASSHRSGHEDFDRRSGTPTAAPAPAPAPTTAPASPAAPAGTPRTGGNS
ncbi:hypothetical protein [Citreimonas salinaria]|uniref:Uncharacterized protein n=1 Tax=Citreimonas salinaria TaxID=321339 RepID=A0A1H3F7B3_9RHOB|nr:hypothetical protein [Citreimonas salinaria]SDX86084.1 hypothetical protein SAMN05444340_101196 [Citreimonas salinaria]